jgi:hypothetical protein
MTSRAQVCVVTPRNALGPAQWTMLETNPASPPAKLSCLSKIGVLPSTTLVTWTAALASYGYCPCIVCVWGYRVNSLCVCLGYACFQEDARTTFWATIPYNRDTEASARSLNPVAEAPNETAAALESDLDALNRTSALTLVTQPSNTRRASLNSQSSTGSKYRSISHPIPAPKKSFSGRLLEFFGFKRADTFPANHAKKGGDAPVHRVIPLDDDGSAFCKVIHPFTNTEATTAEPCSSPPVKPQSQGSAKKYSATTTASSVSASFDSSNSFVSRADWSTASMLLPGTPIPSVIEQLPMSVLLHLDDVCTVSVQKILDAMVDSVTPTVALNDVLKATGIDTCGQGEALVTARLCACLGC